MKTLIWLCTLQILCLTSFSQSPTDSLRTLLNGARINQNPKEIQKLSAQVAWLFFNVGQLDSALKYYHESLNINQSTRDPQLDAYIMNTLGVIYGARGRFDSSVLYYQGALQQYKTMKDTSNARNAEANLSIVFKNVGLYEESLKASLHVISSLKPSDNSILRGSCYNNIGAIYSHTNDYEKALQYYRLALHNRKLNNQAPDVARIHNNIGEIFILTHQYDSAITNLTLAAKIKRQLNDTKGLARTTNNIGKVSMLTGHLKAAKEQFSHAMAIQGTIDDPVGRIECLNNEGELNLITNQLKDAELVLKESEAIIRHIGSPDYLRQNLELQVRLDRERRDFAAGMMHLEQLSAIRDSLLNQEKHRSMQAMQIRYETLKKEQQIAILEQQEEMNRARIRNNQILIGALILGLILVAAVGLLAYANFRNARTARQRIELLLADTRHRTKNNLQTLASIFHLQARYFTDNNMILEAKSSESRVHAMSLLHQTFYSVSEGHSIDLRKYISDLVNQLVDIYGFRTRNLLLTVDVDDIHLDINKALPLSLIIQELVSNAFKYAFTQESTPRLTVIIQVQSNGELQTTVSDNGGGMKIDKARSSQGFSLVDDFVEQLDGNLHVKTEKGTTFIISFPLNPLWKRHVS